MKAIKKIAICILALGAMSFTAAEIDPVEKAAVLMSKTTLNMAVDQGYISDINRQQVLESGIVEAMAKKLVETNYDVAATVDYGAEIAVQHRWFKSKAQAKQVLRKAIDQARNNPNVVNRVFAMLGI